MHEPGTPKHSSAVGMVAAVGLLTALTLWDRAPLRPLDVAVAVLSLAAVIAQLRWPVSGTLAASVLAALSPAATPAASMGALQTAWRRPFPVAAATAAVGVAAHVVQGLLRPNDSISTGWWLVLIAAAYGALLGWGALGRAHRDLVLSLQERARRAEAERDRRVAEARAAERRRLAREMHDILAHHLSLVATHAGALEYRPDAPPDQLATAAGVVRNGVRQALEELRQVIGLLREDDEEQGSGATAVDLHGLVDRAREAGQEVRLRDERPDAALPPVIGRTAHRVLQEGLTNARKHAPGRPVEVALRGSPGADLVIELSNPLPEPETVATVPGSGLGLIGLAERAKLADGHVDHVAAEGRFRLTARLPWPT